MVSQSQPNNDASCGLTPAAEPSAARERPILFSAPMVRALLAGTKTQTRRIVKPQPTDYLAAERSPAPQALRGEKPKHRAPYLDSYNRTDRWCWWDEYDRQGPDWIRCPYGVPGDMLWAREAWQSDVAHAYTKPSRIPPGERFFFRADGCSINTSDLSVSASGWRPGIHMPRWASRITLRVTGVRVERLNDISEADARAEGITEHPCKGPHRGPDTTYWTADGPEPEGPLKRTTPVDAYKALWEEINGDESWGANPFVWAVSFEVLGPLTASQAPREDL